MSVVIGVVLHVPMFFDSASMHYRMVGMPVDSSMVSGMMLILIGFLACVWGVTPRHHSVAGSQSVNLVALDDVSLRRAHVGLIAVMSLAVTIDLMKPITLSFVAPGVAKEYGLKSALHPHALPVALLPLAGIGGTVVGSLLWGSLGDRVGRRASILLAAVMFIGTSICGSMPSYLWNVTMCFIMGLAVGGMLPIAFTLLAETIPARHRSWIMVLVGGDVAGAYIITSALASWLEPQYGWRVLWLLGIPTGVALILLNRWIPESPRFLLAQGRRDDAAAVMAKFGLIGENSIGSRSVAEQPGSHSVGNLLASPYTGLTLGLLTLGAAYGLANFGFLLWLPTNLRKMGYGVGPSDRLLADAALIGLPATFAVAILYGFWSTRKTTVLVGATTATTLGIFAWLGDDVARNRWFLEVLIVALLVGTSSVLAVLIPYSSEVYPTRVRARGTGLISAFSKAGGVIAIGLVATSISPPSIVGAALLGSIPMAVGTVAMFRYGVETRGRPLEGVSNRTEPGSGARAEPQSVRATRAR